MGTDNRKPYTLGQPSKGQPGRPGLQKRRSSSLMFSRLAPPLEGVVKSVRPSMDDLRVRAGGGGASAACVTTTHTWILGE